MSRRSVGSDVAHARRPYGGAVIVLPCLALRDRAVPQPGDMLAVALDGPRTVLLGRKVGRSAGYHGSGSYLARPVLTRERAG